MRQQLVYAGFRRPDDDEPIDSYDGHPMVRRETRPWATVLIVRDGLGRAVWRRPALEATMGELLDAASAGLVDGDPLQPYLIPSIPQGDLGLLGDWNEFLQVLRVLWEVVEAAATVGGAAGAYELLSRVRQRRSDQVSEIVARHTSGWVERGAAPADLFRFLISAERSTQEVAALLGCSTQEAEALLWGMGFVFDRSSARWTYKADSMALLLADDVDLSFADVFKGEVGRKRLRDFASDRLEQFLQTGEPPSTEDALQAVEAQTNRYLDDVADVARHLRHIRRWFRRRDG